MSDIKEKLTQYKRKFEIAKTDLAKLEGREEELQKKLRTEFDCKTLKDAEKLLVQYEEESAELEEELEKGIRELAKEMEE